MEDFWNDRYKTEEYVYGTAPNEFLRDVLSKFKITGTILFPEEGGEMPFMQQSLVCM
ncbi:MAG: hypothetical protein L3J29_09110 [Cyclobacteriaceae bacterium]|nr:hypothetical protein [Cyclobacteriaceae bacterium]